jgi:hypothetical protein
VVLVRSLSALCERDTFELDWLRRKRADVAA